MLKDKIRSFLEAALITKDKVFYTIEQFLMFTFLISSTFLFVKVTTNLLEYYIWVNLIAVLCCIFTEPNNEKLKTIWIYIIAPISKIYHNYKLGTDKPTSKKLRIGINIFFILIMVAASWFATASAYLLTLIITDRIYDK